MKKEYITPRVKVVAVRTMNVLCISGTQQKFNSVKDDKELREGGYWENGIDVD